MPNWDLLDEPWNSLGDWTKQGTGTSEISPAGYLHQVGQAPNYAVGRQKDIGELPTDYTIETVIKADKWGTGGYLLFLFRDGIHHIWIRIRTTDVGVMKSNFTYATHALVTETNTEYAWRFLTDSDGHSLLVYRDENFICEFTDFVNDASSDGQVRTEVGIGTATEMHEDYLRIASGLHVPGVPAIMGPPPTPVEEKLFVECLRLTGRIRRYVKTFLLSGKIHRGD